MVLLYLATFLSGLRPARWYASRFWPVPLALLAGLLLSSMPASEIISAALLVSTGAAYLWVILHIACAPIFPEPSRSIMNRFFSNSRFAAFLLASILTGGAMVAWGFFAGLTGVTLVLSRVDDRARESLYVTFDGRPVIQTISGSRNVSLVYRSLDRQVIPKNELSYGKSHSIDLLHAGHLAADTDAWDAEISRDWMRGYSDGEEMPKYWYLVREGDTGERTYLVGYDAQTSALVGFLGTRGFRSDKPVAEDQFDFGARSLNCTTASLTGSGSRGRMPGSSDEGGGVLALACADQLYCIDLGRQTVDHVALPESAISVAVTKEPRPEGDDLEEDVRLVVRTPEHVLVLDWDDKILRKIPIPTPLVGEEIQVNLPLGAEVVLAETRRTDGGPPFTHELYWIDKDGRATRHESVTIADLNSLDIPSLQIAICAIPSPSALAAIGYLLTSTATRKSTCRRCAGNCGTNPGVCTCLCACCPPSSRRSRSAISGATNRARRWPGPCSCSCSVQLDCWAISRIAAGRHSTNAPRVARRYRATEMLVVPARLNSRCRRFWVVKSSRKRSDYLVPFAILVALASLPNLCRPGGIRSVRMLDYPAR